MITHQYLLRPSEIIGLPVIEKEGPKASTDYNLKRKYAVLSVGGEYRLIKKNDKDGDDFKFVIAIEEMHAALMAAHSAVGHGGEKKTFIEAKKK